MALIVIDSRLAGPLAVAISGLLRWYDAPRDVRAQLFQLQVEMQKVAKPGHTSPSFDPAEISAQAGRMKPLAVTFEDAGALLSQSDRTARRLAKAGKVDTIGDGPGTRVTVESLERYVAEQAAGGAR